MKKVEVRVQLRREVLDPQGKAILKVLHGLGYDEVRSVRAGKLITLMLDEKAAGGEQGLEARAREMVERVLANPVIESADLRIEDAGDPAGDAASGAAAGDDAGSE